MRGDETRCASAEGVVSRVLVRVQKIHKGGGGGIEKIIVNNYIEKDVEETLISIYYKK